MKSQKNTKTVKNDYKSFYIKLASISIAVVIALNLLFNLIFAEMLEKFIKY